MQLADVFKIQAEKPYNNAKPFVLMDIADDDPGRGDTNGYKGLARRVADKIGADFLFLDHIILEGMYPAIKGRDNRLKELFKDRGYPDFIFSRWLSDEIVEDVNTHGTGVIVKSYNECLSAALGIPDYPFGIVPHHLSPEILQREGQRFAEEFQELPRPFIGINLVDRSSIHSVVRTLALSHDAYENASFFICSCRRTPDEAYDEFTSKIKGAFKNKDGRFPIIEFNYTFHESTYGLDETWNPYIGLLDQSDHIIVVGDSRSILSEAIATGKSVYTTGVYKDLAQKGFIKSIFDHPEGTPLETKSIPPIDLTDECADKLIEEQQAQRGILRKVMRKTPFVEI